MPNLGGPELLILAAMALPIVVIVWAVSSGRSKRKTAALGAQLAQPTPGAPTASDGASNGVQCQGLAEAGPVVLSPACAASPTRSRSLKEVGLGPRLLAWIIDLLVWGVLLGVVVAAVDTLSGTTSETRSDAQNLLISLGGIITWFAYFAGMEVLLGATVGKLALRLRVVGVNGGKPGWGAALGRNITKLLAAGSLVGLVVTAIVMERSPYKQRVGDRLAGTTVVKPVATGT